MMSGVHEHIASEAQQHELEYQELRQLQAQLDDLPASAVMPKPASGALKAGMARHRQPAG